MDRSDASALADLQMHWDEAYAIGLDGDIWSARYHGTTDELRAHTSGELRELIRTDYTYRQRTSAAPAAAADLDTDPDPDPDAGAGGYPDSDLDPHPDPDISHDSGAASAGVRATAVRAEDNFAGLRGERMSL